MQTHIPMDAITQTEFNELLDEEFDNGFDIRSPFKRKSRVERPLLCDGLSWDDQFESALALGE